jgi:CBS domain-containing protein
MTMQRRKLTVEDLMSTALVTARPGESVAEADFEMKLASVRHIPVVDDRNRLVGIVSQRDILRAMAGSKSDSVLMRDVMTTQVRTVRASTSAAEAAGLMLQHKIGCLPVLGDDGQLVGLVTESDFVRLARQFLLEPAGAHRTRRAG